MCGEGFAATRLSPGFYILQRLSSPGLFNPHPVIFREPSVAIPIRNAEHPDVLSIRLSPWPYSTSAGLGLRIFCPALRLVPNGVLLLSRGC